MVRQCTLQVRDILAVKIGSGHDGASHSLVYSISITYGTKKHVILVYRTLQLN